MKKTRRKRHKGLSKTGCIYISIIVLLNLIGVGYGYWADGLEIQNTVSTGNIDPVFSDYTISSLDKEKEPAYETIDSKEDIKEEKDKKTLKINIDNAYPGYSVNIDYTITNRGTIPIICKPEPTINCTAPIDVHVMQPSDIIKGDGGRQRGTITITVGDVKENSKYNFSIDLSFKQFNALND